MICLTSIVMMNIPITLEKKNQISLEQNWCIVYTLNGLSDIF